MNEEKNTNKKKILNLYLILAACLLVIAAATITVILAINNADSKLKLDSEVNISGEGDNTNDNAGLNSGDNTGDNTIDNSGTNGGNVSDGSNSGDAENANQGGTDDSTNVSTSSELICPVESVDLINSYTFYKNNTLDCYHFHQGLDFAAEQGTCVYAVQGGVIESITTADLLDGTVITIAHDNGLKSCYKFVEANENLKEGDRVEKGDLIGTVAEANGSEYKDGAHLHFEIYSDGKTIDPENYLDIASK
jgi:murein DD-endopeptidase MepM/ murein hydrolase activator NlpD